MTSPTVDENPEPGEQGYYDWHKAVAKHHNDKSGMGAHHAASRVSVTASGLAVVSSTDVQGALADLDGRGIDTIDTSPLGGSDGDLVGVDGAGSAKAIDSGTYRSNLPIDLGNPHGWGATRGSPTFGVYESPTGTRALYRQSVQLQADGGAHGVAFPFFVPSTVPSWQLKVYWVYSGTSTGDVDFRAWTPNTPAQSDGDDFNNEGAHSVLTQTVTDPGQDVLQVMTGASESQTGWLNLHLSTWSGGSLSSGEVIHVLGAEIVEA